VNFDTLWMQKPACQVCAMVQYWNPVTEPQ